MLQGGRSTTTLAAVQYGDLAAIAPWLNLHKGFTINGCFALITSKGKLGVERPFGRDDTVFYGVKENFAIVGTERTETTMSYIRRFQQDAEQSTMKSRTAPSPEDSVAISDCMLFQFEDNYFTLIARVQSDKHSRIIDPADLQVRIARGIESHRCEHGKENISSPLVPFDVQEYSFNSVLGSWQEWCHTWRFISPESYTSDEDEDLRYKIRSTSLYNDHLKKNVALALSVETCVVVNDGTCCLNCIVQKISRNADSLQLCDNITIINTTQNLREEQASERRYLQGRLIMSSEDAAKRN